MTEFVTYLLFNSDKEVLVQMVTNGSNTGKLNGITTEVKVGWRGEKIDAVVIDNLTRNTGLDVDERDYEVTPVSTIMVYNNNGMLNPNPIVHYYACVVPKDEVSSQDGCTPVTWVPISKVDTEPELFVGNGELQLAVHLGAKLYGLDKAVRSRIVYKETHPF